MSGLSEKEADALQLWARINSAFDEADKLELGLPDPPTFTGWVILAYLATRPDRAASYKEIRSFCKVLPAALTRVIRPLTNSKLARSFADATDSRKKKLILTDKGSNAIGQILRAGPISKDS